MTDVRKIVFIVAVMDADEKYMWSHPIVPRVAIAIMRNLFKLGGRDGTSAN